MLLAVAAILSTSTTLGIVAEASSVSESQLTFVGAPLGGTVSTVDRSAWSSALDGVGRAVLALPAPERSTPVQGVPAPFIGPRPDGPGAADLPQLSGTALLSGLAELSRAEVRDFTKQHPDAVAGLVTNPPAARDVAAWWDGTAAGERATLVGAMPPGVVGQLEGLPYGVRDAANRNLLAQSERDIRDRMAGSIGRAERDELTTRLHMLDQVAAALAAGTVDALAMVGSPGSPARSVGELHVIAGNVWVGGAEWDPIPASGAFGSQPMSVEYGAHHFGVAGGFDPLTQQHLTGALAHNDYFVAGGESFRNLALIGIGQGRYVLGNDGVAASGVLTRGLSPRIS